MLVIIQPKLGGSLVSGSLVSFVSLWDRVFKQYSKSHEVAMQANVRKARGMQMGSVLLDIYIF